eukprot:s2926_g11.t1
MANGTATSASVSAPACQQAGQCKVSLERSIGGCPGPAQMASRDRTGLSQDSTNQQGPIGPLQEHSSPIEVVKTKAFQARITLKSYQGTPGSPHNAGSIRIRTRSESASGRLKFVGRGSDAVQSG